MLSCVVMLRLEFEPLDLQQVLHTPCDLGPAVSFNGVLYNVKSEEEEEHIHAAPTT